MDKAFTLEQLGAAKVSHIQWVNRAKALVEGIPIEKNAIPMDSTECKFGQWFYGEGQKLNLISNMDCLTRIESLHTELHHTYLKIFSIYFGEVNRSFFSKLLNTKKKITAEEQSLAKAYLAELEDISKRLLDEIVKLERRLHALSASAFEDK